jgi:simple sugar transport system substrate-binding protein
MLKAFPKRFPLRRYGYMIINQFFPGHRRLSCLLAAVLVATVAIPGSAMATRQAAAFKLAPRIAADGASAKTLVFRISYHDPSLAFAAPIRAGIADAAKAFHVDATMVGPTGGGADKQVAELQTLMVKGVDGIGVSSSTTDALAPILNQALAQGIPVVTFNTDNPKSHRLAFVGQDLVASGRTAGQQMAKVLGGKGNILIYTLDASAQWSHDRVSGAKQALAAYPNIKIESLISANNNSQNAYSVIQNAMTAHPEVNGILTMDCCTFPAAAQWVQRSHLSGKVKVVGFDLLSLNLQLVKQGAAQVTIGQNPYLQGYDAVKLLYEVVKQHKSVKNIDTGAQIVNQTNVDQIIKEAKAGKVG